MEIDVNIFWTKNEDQVSQQEVGISLDLNDCVLMPVTIYSVDYIRPYKDKYCEMSSGGDLFIVNETADSVKKKIRESREKLLFNSN